ncbi:hypothetical protein SVIOM342S_10342 [Streptomyces violaceorubidus]
MPAPGTSACRKRCTPWSVSGSGKRGARSRDTRTVVVVPASPSVRTVRVTSWPYVESLTTATPQPGSSRWTKRWLHASNLAASQLVLVWVGRWKCPNWVSEAYRSACTSRGKASLRNFSVSCQSTSVSTSSRRSPGARVSAWVTREEPKERTIRTEAPSSPGATSSASVRSVTVLR